MGKRLQSVCQKRCRPTNTFEISWNLGAIWSTDDLEEKWIPTDKKHHLLNELKWGVHIQSPIEIQPNAAHRTDINHVHNGKYMARIVFERWQLPHTEHQDLAGNPYISMFSFLAASIQARNVFSMSMDCCGGFMCLWYLQADNLWVWPTTAQHIAKQIISTIKRNPTRNGSSKLAHRIESHQFEMCETRSAESASWTRRRCHWSMLRSIDNCKLFGSFMCCALRVESQSKHQKIAVVNLSSDWKCESV